MLLMSGLDASQGHSRVCEQLGRLWRLNNYFYNIAGPALNAGCLGASGDFRKVGIFLMAFSDESLWQLNFVTSENPSTFLSA